MARTLMRWHRLQALAVSGAALLFAAQPAAAEGCLLHPARLSDASVVTFKARPGSLLDDNPKGGVIMSAAVRRLAGTDVATVPDLVSLAKSANIPQVVALGAGLAGAVNVCRHKRPDLAEKITEEIKRAQNTSLFAAFAASLSSRQVVTMGSAEPLPSLLGPGGSAGPDGKPGLLPQAFGSGGIVRTVVQPVSPAR
jgi:hypothetical protein